MKPDDSLNGFKYSPRRSLRYVTEKHPSKYTEQAVQTFNLSIHKRSYRHMNPWIEYESQKQRLNPYSSNYQDQTRSIADSLGL